MPFQTGLRSMSLSLLVLLAASTALLQRLSSLLTVVALSLDSHDCKVEQGRRNGNLGHEGNIHGLCTRVCGPPEYGLDPADSLD